MKKLKLTKVIASTLLVASVLALNPIGASASWKQDSIGWWNTDGSSWSVGWKEIDGKWYYFGQDGYMVHDATIAGYKLGSDGAWIQGTSTNSNTQTSANHDSSSGDKEIIQISPPQTSGNYDSSSGAYNTGWKLINGKYYYFSIEGGREQDTTVDGYYLGSDGAWDATKGLSKLQDITMKSEKSVYALGTKDINIYITNNTNLESGYGEWYTVDKFENNEWHQLDFAKDTAFQAVENILSPQKTNQENCKLSTLQDFKNLTAGKYRIVEEISNSISFTRATAEFELQ